MRIVLLFSIAPSINSGARFIVESLQEKLIKAGYDLEQI